MPPAPPLWELTGRRPEDPALDDGRRRVSWGELDERTNAVGHGIEASGLAPGDHVVLAAGNKAEFIEVVLGVQRAGMVVTPLKTSWTPEEIDTVLEDAGTALVATDVAAARRAAARRGLPVLDLDAGFEDWLARQDRGPLSADRRGWRMSYTSGTTGRPKGVVHPWSGASSFSESFVRSTAWAEAAGLPGDGPHLMASQLFHGAPLMFGLATLARGACLRIMPRWEPESFLSALAEDGRSTVLVPTMFRHLLAVPDETRRTYAAPALRTVVHGGEPCPRELKRRMFEWWGPVFVEYFGFTEGGMTLASTADWLARPGTVGRPLPHQDVLILGPGGESLAPGQEGVVYFRSVDGTRFAYFGDEAKSEQAYGPEGSFTAGDVGWMDEDGYLYISGRQADTIVCAGVNVHPAEVEAVVDAVDGVRDVAVVAGPDDERGEQVVAVIVAAPGVDADVLVERVAGACGRALASYKRPRRILVRTAVRRDPTGELLCKALRDELWQGRSRFAATPRAGP